MPRWPTFESAPGGEPPQSGPEPDAVGPVADLEDGERPMRRYPRIVTQPQRHRRAQKSMACRDRHPPPAPPDYGGGHRCKHESRRRGVATWEGDRAWPASRPLRGRSCGTGGKSTWCPAGEVPRSDARIHDHPAASVTDPEVQFLVLGRPLQQSLVVSSEILKRRAPPAAEVYGVRLDPAVR